VYDFLLVINSNLHVGPVSHRFQNMATYRPKARIFPIPSHLAPLLGVIALEFMEKLSDSETIESSRQPKVKIE